MPKQLLLLVIINNFSDSLELQIIDINNATIEELYSIPLLTSEDIEKIIKKRPYKNFKELAESLSLSKLEAEILKNYIYVSKKKNYSLKILLSSKYDSSINLKQSIRLEYNNIMLHSYMEKIYIGYKRVYFGNLRISKGLGLMGLGYYRANTKTGLYFSNSVGFLFNNKIFNIFADTNKNYAIIYNYNNGYFGFLGKENINLLLNINYKIFSLELLKSPNFLNYAYSINLGNEVTRVNLVYRNILERYWDYVNENEKFYISARIKNSPFRVYSRFSNNYYYHSINYQITDGANTEFRFSKRSYKFEFSNDEGLTFAIFSNYALKIGYKFILVYQYKDITSICDEHIPLYGCYKSLEQNQSYTIAINLKQKFWGAFITKKYLYFYLRLSL